MKTARWTPWKQSGRGRPTAWNHGRPCLRRSALFSIALTAVTSVAFGQVETKLLSGEPEPECGGGFGASVAIEGNLAVGGAGFFNCGPGAAIVFEQSGGVWTKQAELTAQGATSDEFGASVAISGQTIVVGSPDDNIVGFGTGSAYVYVFDGSNWVQQQRLTAIDGASNNRFGNAVAISGDTIVVGAWLDDITGLNDGSAYVFVRQAGVWTLDAKLTASSPSTGDHFGDSVAISGSTIVVGSPSDNETTTNSGAAFVFVPAVEGWALQQKLKPSVLTGDSDFGSAVAIDGSRILVGEPLVDSKTGAVYVFERTGSSWVQQVRLTPSDGDPADLIGDAFGVSVTLEGGTAVIGATQANGFTVLPGAAYVFSGGGAVWSEVIKITAGDGVGNDLFGSSVGVRGFTVMVGASGDNNEDGPGDGAVYVYDLDCNGTGTFDAQDIATGASDDCNLNNIPDECEPDCNGNGVVDECDLAEIRYFAVAGNGSQVYELDPNAGWSSTLFCDLASEGVDNVNAADFSAGGFLFVVGGTPEADTLYKIDLGDNCRLVESWDLSEPTEAIAFSPSGLLYFVSGGNTFKTFDVAKGVVVDAFAPVGFDEIQGVDFSGDGRLFAIASDDGVDHDFNQFLEINPATGEVIASGCSLTPGTPSDMDSLDINVSGEFHAVTGAAGGSPDDGVFSLDFNTCQATQLASTSFAFGALASFQLKDCNANGIPDECEPDCNANGVLDACDLDPEDPDEDGSVSEDCNLNDVPDECDVDPADPDDDGSVSDDCNGNGIPDECDNVGTMTYDILLADLIDMTNDCDGSNESRFADATATPGFSWVDSTPGDVISVEIEFNVGIECHVVGKVYNTSLNGVADGSFTATVEFCSCDLPDGVLKSITADANSYNTGGTNTFLVTNLTQLFGMFPRSEWGPGVYGRVTTTFATEPEDCNDNGEADTCDIGSGFSSDGNGNGIPDDCDPVGDADGNGLVNLADYQLIALCMTGICGDPPCEPALYANPACALIDTDNDGDVDLLNIAEFQNVFEGP